MDIFKGKNILKHKFYRDTLIMLIASMLSSFFNYLYQLLMGRFLSPQEYAELFSLLSLFYIFSVFSSTINTSVTKFVAVYWTKQEYRKIKSIIVTGTKILGFFGIVLFLLILLTSPLILDFLHIRDDTLLIVLFVSLPLSMVLPVYQGVLRGTQRFSALSVSIFSWAFFKFLFGVSIVMIGCGVLGGLLGIFLAYTGAFLLTILFLRDLFGYKVTENLEIWGILSYSGQAFFSVFTYTAMWNIDVILVKHYLSPLEAGQYTAISVLGKIVLFAPGAISMVLFPKVAEKYERGDNYHYILLQGLILTLLISGSVVLMYFLFPNVIIQIIYGIKYVHVAPYLWRYGLAMLFLALINVLLNYALSTNRTKIFYPLLLGVVVEILTIHYFGYSIENVINGLSVSMFVGLLFTLIYVLVWGKS